MKKILSILCSSLLLININANAQHIYSYNETVPISDSITLTNTKSFYSDHNISYSVIKADLANPNTSLKLLTPQNGIDRIDTVSNLAKTEENTVAAMNADFFSIYSGTKSFSLGIEMKDGKLLQSPIYPDTMATVSYDGNSVNMSYLDFHIMAVAPNGEYSEIRHLNKHTSYYGDILMYTSDFNDGYSPAPGGVVVEVVVEDGKITEFRRNMPPVKIPENGYVLVVSEGVSMFLANNFNVGDEIKFDYYITPDLDNVSMAFGGGAMLVSEGKAVSEFSHVISGYNPRSAIGMDKSGKTMYLVAVDGRQDGSRGMTMSELASLMESLGCYYAVNLDGGGSTNMVASTADQKELHSVNSPSENRKVINAVGITYTSDDSSPSGIIVKSDKDVVYIGDTASVSASVYNKNMRPIDATVSWSSEHGSVSNNVFVPAKGGAATIAANSGSAYGYTQIYVVDKVCGIDIADYIHLDEGQSTNLDIGVFDSDGHYAQVKNTELFEISSSDPSVVSVSGQTVTGKKPGTAIISVKKDGAQSYSSVTVGNEKYNYENSFESSDGYFDSYPKYVEGNFEISDEFAYSQNRSGKLTYDFSPDNADTKAVYFILDQKQQIDNYCNEVSVSCYAPEAFNHELRAQFIDSNGQIHRAVFGKNLEENKWHTLSAKIPDSAKKPVYLERIYAVYTDGEFKDSGSIYIDNLTFEGAHTMQYVASPQNVYNTKAINSSENNIRIGALSAGTQTLLTTLADNRIINAVQESDSSAIIGKMPTFSTKEDSQALYICLDTSKGGIRNTNSSQWDMMVNAIDSTKKNNIFILTSSENYGSSEFETKVFEDYLSSLGKNITVVSAGERNTYKRINGVSYFTLGNSIDVRPDINMLKNYCYLEFDPDDNTKFSFVNIY